MSFPIERLYETAALGEGWPALLDDIAQSLGVAGCSLISIEAGSALNFCSPEVAEGVARYFREGWHLKNDRMQKLIAGRYTGFIRDIDIYPVEAVAEIPLVKEFYRPLGFGWSAALATPVPTGETLLFSLEQFWERGPLSDEMMVELERLRPHISRAALLTAKIRHQRAAATVEAFETIDTAAALVRTNGMVHAAIAGFTAHDGQISISAGSRLRARDATTGILLENALRHPFGTQSRRPPLSIAVPAHGHSVPLVLHILPTRGEARQVFGDDTALLIVTRVVDRPLPDTGLVRALFDLTPAEARVATALLQGRSSREMAGDFGIGGETVKTQVSAVLQKSGFRRRVDFVRFLSGIATPVQPEE